MHTNKHA